MDRPDWAPIGVDIAKPSAARSYDYLLGGSHNFAVDREAARQAIEAMPDVALQAKANRAFMHRVVRYLVGVGVRQFLDIGSGIPTVGNVHEIAQSMNTRARVVYVDIDPVAVAHSRQILADNDGATAIQEDVRRPDSILGNPELRALLDFDQPVAVLLVAILHYCLDEDDPYGVAARLRDALSPGGYLVVAHPTYEARPQEWARLIELSRQMSVPLAVRSRAAIGRFLEGLELVEPGLVWAPQWHAESADDVGEHPERMSVLVGVGRKP
ncbi:MAG TPA: SAM-dependent methyltransferase [Candidatus Limnocylindrales bacterium]|nr:SAM-dependent methyltransferase [Candidatus Limnocylindrales bacterium]